MEKNKLRPAIAFFLLVFSLTFIFAQEEAGTDENGDKEAVIEETPNGELIPSISFEENFAPEITGPIDMDDKQKNSSFIANLPWNYIISGFILLIIIGLSLLGFLYLLKLIRTETGDLRKYVDDIKEGIEKKYDTQYDGIANGSQYYSKTEDIRDTIKALEKNVSRLVSETSILGDLKNKVDTLYTGKKITDSITSGKLDVTDAFNMWAGNPSMPLPGAFYYINGEVKIRTKCEIKETSVETKWIINRNGTKKYLFPNPNSFNQMTNIPELYKMDQAKLKGRGQNKLRIITPCEITKDGFVEFAGELELL